MDCYGEKFGGDFQRIRGNLILDNRRSPEKLGEILADEFKEIGSSGYMFGKKECLVDGVTLHEMTMHHFEIHPLASEVVWS